MSEEKAYSERKHSENDLQVFLIQKYFKAQVKPVQRGIKYQYSSNCT